MRYFKTIRKKSPFISGAILGVFCFSISLLVACLLYLGGFLHSTDGDSESVDAAVFITMLIVAPLFETAFMFLALLILRMILSGWFLWGALGMLMAAFHAAVYLQWGIIVLLPFLIYAKIIASQDNPASRRFCEVCSAHFFHNLIVFILMLIYS